MENIPKIMIARVKVGLTPAWTDGEKWYCSVKGIAVILNGRASREIVHDEVGGYIPDMSEAMAQYAAQHIPQVTITSITKPRKGRMDSEGRQIVYGSRTGDIQVIHISGRAPICIYCKHFNNGDEDMLSCAAFPEGIPDDIIEGVIVHEHPVPGDHGIQFDRAAPER